ncbi:MAG: V-type ATP synthase subunit F [Lachnospiraceae bacterium]|nr:V-type ATP synthase subunit F [Lachnospiraceae bacterium]
MKTFLISDNIDTATGMRLAGVEGVVVHEKNELSEAFDNLLKDKDVGIIFVTELLSTKFPEIVANIKRNYKRPLILEIPDRHGSKKRVDFITSYINEAIGIKI